MGNMTEGKDKINEGVRVIRWRMKHEEFRWRDEIRIIPGWIWGVAVTLLVLGQVAAQIVNHFNPSNGPMIKYVGIAAVLALGADLLLLVFTYVNRDAKRRGMNSTLWTLLAIFVPYLIGLIVYFLMREPLPYTCPQCGAQVSARFNFCPSCKCNLRPACPRCNREIRAQDKYCPYCANDLAAPA